MKTEEAHISTLNIFNFISYLLFNTSVYYCAFEILYLLGLSSIFKKCGLKRYLVLLPGVREYSLARCAAREPEGRVAAITSVIGIILNVMASLGELGVVFSSDIQLIMRVVSMIVQFIGLIYFIRIYIGLSEIFHRKKIWIILWILDDWIPALIWGFSKKFRPTHEVEEIEKEVYLTYPDRGVESLSSGLSVNLKNRVVSEFFQKKYLLSDICMNIQVGHMVLLLGGSGAGKTTFVNAVNGYEKANASILLNNVDLYKNYKRMQYDIGFVPQFALMRGKDTVEHTLLDASMLRLPMDISKADRKKRVDEVLDMFGLTVRKHHMVEKLSGGQAKRLSISMEFLSNPSLFILDEPDSGLDGVMARELFEKLRAIANQGKIVIVITHTPDRVVDLFDDVIVLAKDKKRVGRLAFYGSIKEARSFFECDKMEEIVQKINPVQEGGKGLSDLFIDKYAESRNVTEACNV